MAKKLRFTGMNQDVMTLINRALEVRFVRIEALGDIRKALKKLDIEREDLVKVSEGLDSDDPKKGKLAKAIEENHAEVRKLEVRKQAISGYARAFLQGTRGKDGIPGAYRVLTDIDGIGMFQYYKDSVDRESINDTKDAMGYKSAVVSLMNTWGLQDAPDALKAKFANIVCLKSLGVQTASGAKIVKGELLAYKSEMKYLETLVDIMVDYMNRKGGVEVVVPNKADYDYEVKFGEKDGDITIESFRMVSKDDKDAE